MSCEKKIALLGQPNSGKSTVFNTLTGSHMHVGNWPGKTVEKSEGYFFYNNNKYIITDLPGSYCLSANSDEERVTRNYVSSDNPDLILILADSSQLERSLYMLSDFAGINAPSVLVLTMADVATQKGKKINTEKLSFKLGIPVISITAHDKNDYPKLLNVIENSIKNPKYINTKSLFEIYKKNIPNNLFNKALNVIPEMGIKRFSPEWLAVKLIEGDKEIVNKLYKFKKDVDKIISASKDGNLHTSDCKFKWISYLVEDTVTSRNKKGNALCKFDKIALDKILGKPIAIGIILLGLMLSMLIASPIMRLGESIPSYFAPIITNALTEIRAPQWLISFICSSFLTALSCTFSMLGFVFGMNLVFGLIEEVGYMARIAYVFDNLMCKLGLQGKSIMPMLVGFGCTVGGTAGTRVIDSWGQKVLTMALVWAVPCGATFAVIPLLANAFFDKYGFLVIIGMFIIMFLHIAITSKILGPKLSPKESRTGLIMELPPYHKPKWSALLNQTVIRVKDVFKKAFLVIFIILTLFWIISFSSNGNTEESVLFQIGAFIEPITKFFGMSAKTFAAFISSMISKEAVLGVLSALYSDSGMLLNSAINAKNVELSLTSVISSSISKPEALAFMTAVTFNVPCVMAVASTYQECRSIKWVIKLVLYYFVSALILSFIVYRISDIFW